MNRALIPFALLGLAACGNEAAPSAPKPGEPEIPSPSAAPQPTPSEPDAVEQENSADAAEVLRSYYAAIEHRDYEAAARMRSDEKTDAKRLADNFKAYESYNVQVFPPSRPTRSGEYLFVDVPVMITGSYKSGKTFGSGGRVTMRRTAEGGAWRVYTG
ncbi:MAG TPA: hypothetical protein VIT45_02425 [Allosphingosinicella sp.]